MTCELFWGVTAPQRSATGARMVRNRCVCRHSLSRMEGGVRGENGVNLEILLWLHYEGLLTIS